MTSSAGAPRHRRADHSTIAGFIAKDSRVLDVGCGDGQLMEMLIAERGARCQGLEISQRGVNRCVAKGLSVVQGNADIDLPVYPDNVFDYAVLSKTVQELTRPAFVLGEMSRLARRVVISFRNYGHWRARLHLMVSGRAPVLGGRTTWFDEGPQRICTVRDMIDLADHLNLKVSDYQAVASHEKKARKSGLFNLLAEEAVLLLERRD